MYIDAHIDFSWLFFFGGWNLHGFFHISMYLDAITPIFFQAHIDSWFRLDSITEAMDDCVMLMEAINEKL